MVDFKLDRLAYTFKGHWVTDSQYQKDDIVFYKGKAYVCLQEHTAGANFYNDLDFSGSETVKVTVGNDSLTQSNTAGVFYFDDAELHNLNLIKGKAYVFDQSDSSNVDFNGHINPLLFSLGEDGPRNGNSKFTRNVFYFINDLQVDENTYLVEFEEADRRKIQITIPFDMPDRFYVYSAENADVGTYHNSRYFSNWDLMFDGREWRNVWNVSIFYSKGSVVRYNGNVYICVEPHVSAQTNDLGLEEDIEKWQLLSQVDTWASSWNPDTKYTANDIVRYGGIVYRCTQGHVSSTSDLGLESDADNWTILSDGVEYKGSWTSDIRYKPKDVVRYGPGLFVCLEGHTSSDTASGLRQDISFWEVYVPGLDFADQYDSNLEYSKGNIVQYGGNLYLCTRTTRGGLLSGTSSAWEQLTSGYYFRGDFKSTETYKAGEIVHYSGTIWVSLANNTDLPQDSENWKPVVPGTEFKGRWTFDTNYEVNQIVTFIDTAYVCITSHNSAAEDSRPDRDENINQYWIILAEGAETNVLQAEGDIKQRGLLYNDERLVIGKPKSVFSAVEDDRQTVLLSVTVEQNVESPFNSVFAINKNQYPSFDIKEKVVYILNQDDASNDDHPLNFSETQDGTHNAGEPYEVGVVYRLNEEVVADADAYAAGFNNASTREIQITPEVETPDTLYYYDYNQNSFNPTGVINKVDSIRRNTWQIVSNTPRAFYVSNDGVDSPDYGKSEDSPWQTIRYAANYLLENVYGTLNTSSLGGDYIIQKAIEYIVNDENTADFPDLSKLLNSINPRTKDLYMKIDKSQEAVSEIDSQAVKSFYDGGEVSGDIRSRIQDIESEIYYNSEKYKNDEIYISGVYYNVINQEPPNTTIYVKTGIFKELLPISVPERCAIVGEELRSTTVSPAEGYEQNDMFYVRNGSGIRSMTMSGLNGELGDLNQFLTRRPTAGAYVSLDPGSGPDDSSVWITTRSPYIQNVTTLGTGCIGVKIDGALHESGNDSIVANDFTQVLSDGIGAWADNVGRTELVSVFTYYCHIGYLCTNGGIIRGTNGNNSYGEFGSVAEGFDVDEEPIEGNINNRTKEAQFEEAFTYGIDEQSILAVGYSHAGQEYSEASITFGGSGTGADAYYDEFRQQAISKIRVLDPEDSFDAGGINYTFVVNSLQSGNDGEIYLSQAEVGSKEQFEGQRLVIQSGLGVGQYGKIEFYNPDTKQCIISRESDQSQGFDHFQPGYPIEPELDSTSTYAIEPRVDVEEPIFESGTLSGPSNRNWKYLAASEDRIVAITQGSTTTDAYATYSDNGSNWSQEIRISTATEISGIVYSGTAFIAIKQSKEGLSTNEILTSLEAVNWSDITLPTGASWQSIATDRNNNVVIVPGGGAQSFVYSNDGGLSYNLRDVGTTQQWCAVEYGNEKFVALDSSAGDVAVSTDNGVTWTINSAAIPAYEYTDITYGNGRFVAIAPPSSTGDITRFSYSFDGENWYTGSQETENFEFISYSQGVFVATGDSNVIGKSADGKIWRIAGDDSTSFALSQGGFWGQSLYFNNRWHIVQESSTWNTVTTGAKAIIRAKVEAASVSGFTIYDPGSNYQGTPQVTVFDNSASGLVVYSPFLNDGVLAQPEMRNRGQGYVTVNGTITGNGFADLFQTGTTLFLQGVTKVPGPGANLLINGVSQQFSISKIEEQVGNGPYDLQVQIRPNLSINESPDHNTSLIIRERYSQLRLTGHDFLDIGTGNFKDTDYPNLYVFGEDAENPRRPFNETVASGGGRVFYTSTDQDGNFRAGELFAVEQASGIVTIDASQFDLSGLTEISLGGIQLGGTNVIIREFSKDPTFVASTNNIVPTQRAIASYLENKISTGDGNATTNTLIAAQTVISDNDISNAAEQSIQANSVLNIEGLQGTYLAAQFFAYGSNL